MKITIWENEIEFADELKVKHMRELSPILSQINNKDVLVDEMWSMVDVSKIIFISINGNPDKEVYSEIVENFNMTEVTQLLEFIWKILNNDKDSKK